MTNTATATYPALHPDDFAVLHERFNFTVDAAADDTNNRLERYWTPADDGLAQDWTGERVFCHPPFEDVTPWVLKAEESNAELVAMLLPHRPYEDWWGLLAASSAVVLPLPRLRLVSSSAYVYVPRYRPLLAVFGDA